MKQSIPKRILGRTGLEVTQLSYGANGAKGPPHWHEDGYPEDCEPGVYFDYDIVNCC